MAEPTLNTGERNNSDEIVVEISTHKNGYVLFGPLGNEKLRGRWDNRFIAGKSGEAIGLLAACAFYPGIRLGVNLRTGTTRRFDPMGLPEFANELKVANQIANAFPQMFGGNKVATQPEALQSPETDADPESTANRLKDWLYWTSYLVKHNLAIVVNGELPDEKTIREKIPGSRRRHHCAEIYSEVDEMGKHKPVYVDRVPLRGKGQPQEAAA